MARGAGKQTRPVHDSLRQLLEAGLLSNPIEYLYIDAVGKTRFDFPSLEFLKACLDFNKSLTVFGDEIALIDGKHLLAPVQYNVRVRAVACPQEQVILNSNSGFYFKLDSALVKGIGFDYESAFFKLIRADSRRDSAALKCSMSGNN
jgi:hypothetical protein